MACICLAGYIWAVRDALDSADLALEGNIEPTRAHLKESAYFGRFGILFLLSSVGLFIFAKRKEKTKS
ncbi:hypothetical protein DDZ13_13035 [Coraliomargarita sinensis]|uniref:Uncharacterized protein n=1 Tax=Coraliomargarita sinensis TaxID=2174842 RepID=A0A317ZJ34_9BACT|nr:hypothetical protein DDZ13_13035 [Coraliomargarita sinensis]